MMKLLLDTHVFLWRFLEPDRLSRTVKEALEEPSNEIWLSPITTWECLLLARKGRAILQPNAGAWLRERLKELRPTEAPLNHEIAFRSETVDLTHSDPADRFLAATAAVFDLTLVTADQRLMRSESIAILANE